MENACALLENLGFDVWGRSGLRAWGGPLVLGDFGVLRLHGNCEVKIGQARCGM